MFKVYAILVCLPGLILANITLKPYDQSAETAFYLADVNHDGIFDHNEQELFFKGYDKDDDGIITYGEFTNDVFLDTHDTHIYHALFSAYDVNQDHEVTHRDFELYFALVDTNGDNLLSRQEFVRYLTKIFEIVDSSAK